MGRWPASGDEAASFFSGRRIGMPVLEMDGFSTHFGGPPALKNKHGSTNIQAGVENGLESKLKPFSVLTAGAVEMLLPIETVPESNGGRKRKSWVKGKLKPRSEHWSEAATRHKRQKGTVAIFLRQHKQALSLPCHITLTRYAPLKLDRHDNLPMSLKWILDAICEIITGDYVAGRADSSELIEVTYKQITCKNYYVGVNISFN